MVSGYQNGTIAQLLQAIIGQINFDGEPISNIGEILLSILEQTPYDDEPKSVLAELFLKLKAKLENEPFEPYDKEPTSAIAEILLSILNETEYDKEPNSRIAELLLELKAELESYAEITVSGAIANFTTSVIKPLVNLKAYFEATGGGGTPASPIAISGVSAVSVYHSGANLWDEQHESGTYDQTTGEKTSSSSLSRNKNPISVKPNTNYYWLRGNAQSRIFFYDKSLVLISSSYYATAQTITTPANCYYVNFAMANDLYTGAEGFNYPATDTDYHAYNPNSNVTLINLGGTYYGGYVEQDKDGKRELVVTYQKNVFSGDNSEGWNFDASGTKARVYTNAVSNIKVSNLNIKGNIISPNASIAAYPEEWKCCIDATGRFIIGVDSTITSKTDWHTYLANNNLEVVFELDEPFTVALPDGEPILAFNGVNNVWNDSGDTSVTYLAKIEDNLRSAAKFRANLKAEKQTLKEEKELKELEEKETIKEPIKKA